MKLWIHDYETRIDKQTCKLGESILISSTLDAHVPCSHLYFLGDIKKKVNVNKFVRFSHRI